MDDEIYYKYLKRKALKALINYQAAKKREAVLALMARKANYLRRLKSCIKLLRRNII